MYDKENVYDEEIAPLMRQITEICKREKIPMAAQFYLKEEREDEEWEGQPMYCTTVLPFGKREDSIGHERIHDVAETMRYGKEGKPQIMTAIIKRMD